ncbi:MAG: DnaD domain protein [Clostridia bacterium]|nr:DnaD domain protein [Clostridia bacterium]
MPLCRFSDNYFMLGVTPVENIFILNFLPHAPGDYVRAYLYGLMQCCRPDGDMSMEKMANLLGMEPETVKSAFQYWERQGIVQRVSDNPPAYEYLNIAAAMNGESPVEKLVYRYRDFNTKLQQIFGSRLLHPADFTTACEWVEDLHLPEEVVLVMAEHYVRVKGKSFQFKQLEKTALQWAEQGINTVEAAQDMLSRDSSAYKAAQKVLDRFNLRRAPTREEVDLARKWLEEWKLTEEAVLVACRETVKGRSPSFGYLDGILSRNQAARTSADMAGQLDEAGRLREAVKAIHTALGIQQMAPTPAEIDIYRNFIAAGFSPEIILHVAKNMGSSSGYDMDRLNQQMAKFVEMGLTTDMQITEFMDKQRLLREQAARVYEKSGQDARVTTASAAQMEEWLALASFPVVLFAAECARGTKLPSQYITKLLKEWKKSGVTTVEEARRQREAIRPASAQQPVPTALQYEQRAYTPEQLGALTNTDLDKYMGEDKHGAS